MIDLATVPNPYDFANPVSDADLFVGRKKEMDEIKYYLDHAKSASRPINIALLGERAAGKTSLLNMTQIEAEKRGFLAVRVDLDEDDAASHMAFFFKIFDATFSTACGAGAFEGRNGKTFEAYLDMVSAYTVPEDKTFCPFIFPAQYAKAMAAGNEKARASDTTFKSDLAEIRREINRPVVILFDEGNVLAKSRTHLEKLRNIFMNTPGFMLVLTGTPDLFPIMDEVFSPIIRQFKKVQVGRFESKEETRDCIRKPLEKIGISDPNDIFDFETYRDVGEIHDLTGGKPYEVQLLCHTLFRRVQEKRATKMKLDLSVLEDVRMELENTQDISARPILTRIRALDKTRLTALGLFSECDGRTSFDQVWAIEFIFNGESRWTRDKLYDSFQQLMGDEVVLQKGEAIKFKGDDFDRIYTKYYAREQDVGIHFLDAPPALLFQVRLIAAVKDIDGLDFSAALMVTPLAMPEKILEQMAKGGLEGDNALAGAGVLAIDLYTMMMHFDGERHVPVVHLKFSGVGFTSQSLMYGENPAHNTAVDECFKCVSVLAQRASQLGLSLDAQRVDLPAIPLENLAKNIERSGNERLRKSIARLHYAEMRSHYLKGNDIQKARLHADFAYRYDPSPSARDSNDLGYFLIMQGDDVGAERALKYSIEASDDDFGPELPLYNLAILNAKTHKYDDSIDALSAGIERAQDSGEAAGGYSCLIVPRLNGSTLSFEEVRNVSSLVEAARTARECLLAFLGR